MKNIVESYPHDRRKANSTLCDAGHHRRTCDRRKAPIKKSVHFVSLNIERDKHFDAIIPFLKKQNPDVVCLQEVFEKDIPRLEKELGMKGYFAVMFRQPVGDDVFPEGVAIFTKFPVLKIFPLYYKNGPENMPVYKKYVEGEEDVMAGVLFTLVIDVSGIHYTIGTTHFTWTPHGEADDRQRHDVIQLLKKADECKEGIIFSGDFNAPRGREIFDIIAKKFKDNIPAKYETSLDVNLHRAPEEVKYLMVDGLFSTPAYTATNVSLEFGISDHAAIVADIAKK